MITSTWLRPVRRGTPGPVALAATAVLVTAGAGSLMPAGPAVAKTAETQTAETQAVATQTKSASPCSASAKACMDLSKQQAWLTDGAGHITYGPVPARGGAKGAKTPKGTFSVISKDQHHLSREFNNAPMPYSVFFYPGDAFHSGNPATASNGCIHLSPAAAQRFFSGLNVGDPVEVK